MRQWAIFSRNSRSPTATARALASTALLASSMHVHKGAGMTEVALGVHTTNPNGAFQLYSNMGYEETKTSAVYRKPMA